LMYAIHIFTLRMVAKNFLQEGEYCIDTEIMDSLIDPQLFF
jgi:hypothetical protein